MKKAIATLAIAGACVVVAPAEAHGPNTYTGWRYFTAAGIGLPKTGTVTNLHIRQAVERSLDRYRSDEYLITAAIWSGSRTSSTSGWATHFADLGWRYTPMRVTWLPEMRIHVCQADRGSFAAGAWRVRCTQHMSRPH